MINLVVAGDFSPMNRFNNLLNNGEIHQLKLYNKGEDELFLLNFETTIECEGSKEIDKAGPHLRCSKEVAPYLKGKGVDAVTMANNHTMDYGTEGLLYTLKLLHSNGIETVGAGHNPEEAAKVLYLRQKDETVAIINCCEHEFSYAENSNAGTNPLDVIDQYDSIKEAKTNADYVVLIIHGGHEFHNLPSPRMVKTYRFFIDAGADAVINHHQHCYSGFEYWHGKPIYYGLGNFCFDWPGFSSSFYTGYCVRLHLDRNVTSEELPYTQCLEQPIVDFREFDGFRSDLERLNSIIINPERLNHETLELFKKKETECKGVLTPFSNHYLNALVLRGYLPAMISKKRKLLLKAYVDCESHRDVMLNFLKRKD